MKKKINARRKGKAGEHDWVYFLRKYGHKARRGVQFQGSLYSPDVVCDTIPAVHHEVKRVEDLNIEEALQQSIRDAGIWSIPIVAHRKNHEEWKVTLRASDFLRFFIPPYIKSHNEQREKQNPVSKIQVPGAVYDLQMPEILEKNNKVQEVLVQTDVEKEPGDE